VDSTLPIFLKTVNQTAECGLEHISAKILPSYIQDFHRLLKPGAYSIHQIDLADHFFYYDRKVPSKNYLRYSDKVWKRYFENDLQYFNRLQRPGWHALFEQAGLELIEEEPIYTALVPPSIDAHYAQLDPNDLKCWTLRVVHRRPRGCTKRPEKPL